MRSSSGDGSSHVCDHWLFWGSGVPGWTSSGVAAPRHMGAPDVRLLSRNSSQEQEQATQFTTTLPYQIMFDNFGVCLKVVYPVSLIPTDYHNILHFQTNPCVSRGQHRPHLPVQGGFEEVGRQIQRTDQSLGHHQKGEMQWRGMVSSLRPLRGVELGTKKHNN